MKEPSCPVVRTLDIVGEKWSWLIVRNALRGETRFSQFSASLGAPSDILSARLAKLVAAGVLEKRTYRDEGSRERTSYHLTPKGEGLRVILAAMGQWNDEHNPAPQGRASRVVDSAGHDLQLAFVDAAGRQHDDAHIVPGPAATTRW